jgi:hypothetical protein
LQICRQLGKRNNAFLGGKVFKDINDALGALYAAVAIRAHAYSAAQSITGRHL